MSSVAPPVADTPGNGTQENAPGPAPGGQAAPQTPAPRQGGGMGGGLAPYAAERRIQLLALASLLVGVGLNSVLVGFGDSNLLGLTVPAAVVLGLLAAPLALGTVAVVRRSMPFLAATLVVLVGTTFLERPWEVAWQRLLLALVYGFSVLAFAELVHMTRRYEKLHEAIDKAGSGEESLDHAVGEYLKTFAYVFSLTIALGGAVGFVFFTLREFGPAQHRYSLDYTSVYGLVGAAFLLFATIMLLALAKGADFSLPRRERAADDSDFERPSSSDLDEVDVDARP